MFPSALVLEIRHRRARDSIRLSAGCWLDPSLATRCGRDAPEIHLVWQDMRLLGGPAASALSSGAGWAELRGDVLPGQAVFSDRPAAGRSSWRDALRRAVLFW